MFKKLLISFLNKMDIFQLTEIISNSYRQKQKNDYTAILAGYAKSLMQDDYGYKPK